MDDEWQSLKIDEHGFRTNIVSVNETDFGKKYQLPSGPSENVFLILGYSRVTWKWSWALTNYAFESNKH